jgi:flagellar protein FliS
MDQPRKPVADNTYPPISGARRAAASAYQSTGRPLNAPLGAPLTSPPLGGSINPPQVPGQNAYGQNKSPQNDAYKKTQIETATPENLILMLYDGALRFIGQAELAFEENNIEKISNLLLRIQAIFNELMSSLDKEKGGDIAVNLERLYLFFLKQLSEANIKKDPMPMLQIKPLVEELRNTWEQAMQQNQGANSPKPPPQRPRLNLAV